MKNLVKNTLLTNLLEEFPARIAIQGTDHRIYWVNKAYCDATGLSPEEIKGRKCCEICGRSTPPPNCPVNGVFESGQPCGGEVIHFENKSPLEAHISWYIKASPVRNSDGNVIGAISITEDVTSHKEAIDKTREQAETIQSIVNSSQDWIWAMNLQGLHTYSNVAVEKILGYKHDEFIGKPYSEYMHPDDLAKIQNELPRLIKKKRGWQNHILRWKHKDDSWRTLESSATPIINSNGNVVGFRGVDRDITSRMETENALHETEQRFKDLVEMLPEVVFETDQNLNLIFANQHAFELFGYSEGDLKRGMKAFEFIAPEDHDRVKANIAIRNKGDNPGTVEYKAIKKDGSTFPVLFHANPIMKEGEIFGLRGLMIDITERRQAEETLNREKERAETYLNIAGVIMVALDSQGTVSMINKKGCNILGYDEADILGKNWMDNFVPERIASDIRDVSEQLLLDEPDLLEFFENPVLTRGGEERLIAWHNTAIRNKKGEIIGLLSSGEDITERRQSEEAGALLEEQYHQAQKVESIGRLAGGVAHDLNNLLTPILGYSEMLMDDLDPDDTRRESVDEILRAGFRARDLVRQLLAFSRKQTLEYRPVDLNIALTGFEKLLRRTIREDIKIKVIPSPDIRTIMADIGQIEQVIMNLAVNAQDAMPEGGRLTIETATAELDKKYAATHQGVKPGAYVMLAISDTGCGMDEETLEHVFEPFFTTKSKDKGTGLGLSTVYGIVKQHDGNIWAYSEPGKGTTFKVYLPVSGEVLIEENPGESISARLEHSETILLVEDNQPVRDLAHNILKRQGYTVHAAENGPEALTILASLDGPVDLLLTDVVMPEMNGKDLFDKVAERHPETKVLYMSGYTDDTIAHHGVLDEGTAFIQKPFNVQGLAAKVREVLEQGIG